MHLVLSQRAKFPVRHLLALAKRFAIDFVDNLGQTDLILLVFDRLPVGLHVEEAGKLFEEFHLGQGLLEHARVASEGKPNAQASLIREDLRQFRIQYRVVCQCDQIDHVGVSFTAELEDG